MREAEVVQLKIKCLSKGYVFIETLVVPILCSPISNQRTMDAKSDYEHLKELYLSDFVNKDECELKVDLLIGLDYYFSFLTGRCVRGNEGPVASESCIGWILGGPLRKNLSDRNCDESNSNYVGTHVMKLATDVVDENVVLNETLSKFWDVENIDELNEDDVMSRFEKDIVFNGKRYVTKLPFKEENEVIPDNYSLCVRRLDSLQKRLRTKPELFKEYDEIFQQYKKDGIIEQVEDDEISECGKVHYLPHRPVVRHDKETTKVRVVFDASAKTEGPSLNESLYPGPNLLAKIFDILLRFRTNKIAIISDIKQAFLNIEIAEEHKNYLRFLWYDDVSDEKARVIVLRFLRVVFGVTSSPFLLNGTIRYHCRNYEFADVSFIEKFLQDLGCGPTIH